MGFAELTTLFRPRSLAVIGASEDATKIGGRPIAFLKRAGFPGPIYPINPQRRSIQGIEAFSALAAVPDAVDHAIIAVSAKQAVETIDACAAKGVRSITMFTAGLGELDGVGRCLQEDIAVRCRAAGIRLLGPNSLGFCNVADRVFSTFSGAFEFAWPKLGSIGIASQSGAFGAYCYSLLIQRNLGISHFITTGNEADVDVAECIEWLANDPATSVIAAYIEGCRDGSLLRRALARAAERRKPVVLMKVGVSEVGAAAALSHTGSLGGSDAAYQAAFDEAGVHRAASLEEMIDVIEGFTAGVVPKGRSLGVISVSGGAGVLLSDAGTEHGLELRPLPQDAQDEIRALVPFAGPRNPVDTTAQVRNDQSLFTRILQIMAGRGGFDILIAFVGYAGWEPTGLGAIQLALADFRRQFPDRLLILCMSSTPERQRELQEQGFLMFADPRRAVQVAAALERFGNFAYRAPPSPRVIGVTLPEGALDEVAAKRALAAAGLPFLAERMVADVEAAVVAAEEMGYPVALKVVSPDIPHKSEVGGVALDLADVSAVRTAWGIMMARVLTDAPVARILGAIISPMVRGGVETVIGVHRDPTFGPLMMFGLGGVFVEVMQDVVFRLAPIDREQALAMIEEIKGRPLLHGARGHEPVDREAIADALVALSDFACEQGASIRSAEINPMVVFPDGAVALDAAIERA